MTKEIVKAILPILHAYLEGKRIACHFNAGWQVIESELPLENLIRYPDKWRIEPEPEYRSFNTIKECWSEMQKHQPFGWVKSKGSGAFFNIESLYILKRNKVRDHCVRTSYGDLYLCDMFKRFTFADGTPFGITVEEDKK